MELARTAIESVTLTIESSATIVTPPDVAVGTGTSSPGKDAQWVTAAWSESGQGGGGEVTLQIAGPEAPETPALRIPQIGYNYLYVRFGTVVRKAVGVVEVR